jgi:hypothetical protein
MLLVLLCCWYLWRLLHDKNIFKTNPLALHVFFNVEWLLGQRLPLRWPLKSSDIAAAMHSP